mgnify:CR=1 FL=1
MVKPWFFRPLHPQSSLPYDIPLNHHFSLLLWGLLGQTKIDGEHPWFPVRNMIYKWWVSTLLCTFAEGYYMEVSNDCMKWDTPMK